MPEPTQRRGSGDTGMQGRSGGLPHVRGASQRDLRAALLVAFLLHLPFVPNPLSGWMEILLSLGDGEVEDYEAGETIIPLDLDLLASEPVIADQAPSAAPTGAPPDTVP
ncbi:MAG TPA: hypothetical protein VLS89_18360, partial [Candidatus Nanopelagicales bacterium]|nr:hypothetical protein [Candidatus Nanopelagicales bacterium]